MAPIAQSILSDFTRRLDRNRNNRLESAEARVRGWIGNLNGVAGTQETASSVARGEAVIDRFYLNATDAGQVSRKMSRQDGWIARDEIFISANARKRIDGTGGTRDGKISEREMSLALGRGDLAITRDGIYLSSEVSSPSRPVPPPIDRPSPPPIDPRPVPPPIDRPSPPPIDPRPVPPPINPGYPVPPPIDPGYPVPPPVSSYRSPAEIMSRFTFELADLKRTYNSTPMTGDTFKRLERGLYQRTAEDLVGAVSYPFAERNTALKSIYNSTSMNGEEFKGFERRLYSREAEYILGRTDQSFSERINPLKSLYNSTSMNSEEFKGFERRLIQQEVDRIAYSSQPLYNKLDALNRLYNGSSMTSAERDAAARRIENSAYGRY